MITKRMTLLIVIGVWAGCGPALAEQPSGRGPVIARGEVRDQIAATAIQDRPYRPMHVYGNSVRRRHHRGRAVQAPRDVERGNTEVTAQP
jgi:hypothetical protein